MPVFQSILFNYQIRNEDFILLLRYKVGWAGSRGADETVLCFSFSESPSPAGELRGARAVKECAEAALPVHKATLPLTWTAPESSIRHSHTSLQMEIVQLNSLVREDKISQLSHLYPMLWWCLTATAREEQKTMGLPILAWGKETLALQWVSRSLWIEGMKFHVPVICSWT